MYQHAIAGADTARVQAAGQPRHIVGKFRIAPRLAIAGIGRPHQHWMIATLSRPRLEQKRRIAPHERMQYRRIGNQGHNRGVSRAGHVTRRQNIP